MRDINTTNLQDILTELNSGFSTQIDYFNSTFEGRSNEFAMQIRKCFELHNQLPIISPGNERERYSLAYSYFAIDCVFTSFQQLMIGYILPAGNMMRSSLESIALSVLFSHEGYITRRRNKIIIKFSFYDDFLEDRGHAKAHKAIETAKRNWEVLGIQKETIEIIDSIRSSYNSLCHASPIAMAARATRHVPPQLLIGGDISDTSIEALNVEIDARIHTAKTISSLLEGLVNKENRIR